MEVLDRLRTQFPAHVFSPRQELSSDVLTFLKTKDEDPYYWPGTIAKSSKKIAALYNVDIASVHSKVTKLYKSVSQKVNLPDNILLDIYRHHNEEGFWPIIKKRERRKKRRKKKPHSVSSIFTPLGGISGYKLKHRYK